MSSKLSIVMYHYVRDLKHSRYPGIKGLDVGLFRKQLGFLCQNYRIVSMEQVIDAIVSDNDLPENACLLTFDDGYTDCYTFVLPILEEYGVQGSFFIPAKIFVEHKLLDVNKIHFILANGNSDRIIRFLYEKMDYYRGREFDFASNEELYDTYGVPNRFDNGDVIFIKRMLQNVLPEQIRSIISSELFEREIGIREDVFARELYMSRDQIRTMKRHGMYIGIHGYDHYWLGKVPEDRMKADIDKALESMDEFVDTNKWVMNYPYGDYSDEVISYVKSRGGCAGITVEARIADIKRDNAMALPRFDCNDYPPKSEEYKNRG